MRQVDSFAMIPCSTSDRSWRIAVDKKFRESRPLQKATGKMCSATQVWLCDIRPCLDFALTHIIYHPPNYHLVIHRSSMVVRVNDGEEETLSFYEGRAL